jgi:YesN/AraC family two-component response regulator
MANILLVDDDIAVVDALRAMLKSSGHNVTTAENGRVGQTKLAEGRFDLVITDIIMPEMEGIELIANSSGPIPRFRSLRFQAADASASETS